MKAEERKQIETNSLSTAIERVRNVSGRTVYYVAGSIILVVAAFLLYRYFAKQSRLANDEKLLQLADADTPEKLKAGMEAHRGTTLGSVFKMHLARNLLRSEGLPKLGTDKADARKKAADSVQEARDYFLELTKELKEKEEPALLQEAWLSAAQAEETLVGLPATEGGTDYRGSADKAIEYFDKASSIFADKDFSKKFKERADMIRADKEGFIARQREFYKPGLTLPPLPGLKDVPSPTTPKLELPPLPKTPLPGDPEVPAIKGPEGTKKSETPEAKAPALPPIPPIPPVIDPKKQ